MESDNELMTPPAQGDKRLLPYVSFSTLKTFIEDLHEHGVPARIDRSILKRFSGSVGSQLLQALRSLDLLAADDRPTNYLDRLAKAYGTDEWPGQVSDMVLRAYGPLFTEAPVEQMTPAMLSSSFKDNFVAKESVLQKCKAFFLAAATEGKIPLNARIMKEARVRTGPRKPKAPKAPKAPAPAAKVTEKPKGAASEPPPPPDPEHGKPLEYQLLDLVKPTTKPEVQAAIWVVIQHLKSEGQEH